MKPILVCETSLEGGNKCFSIGLGDRNRAEVRLIYKQSVHKDCRARMRNGMHIILDHYNKIM